jgi:hypothetical protein
MPNLIEPNIHITPSLNKKAHPEKGAGFGMTKITHPAKSLRRPL